MFNIFSQPNYGILAICVCTEEGRLYQWGLDNEVVIRGPTLIRDLSNEKVLRLSCGRKHTIALTG